MRRLAVFLAFVVLVVACQSPSAPRQFVLGPGCWTVLPLYENGREIAHLKVHYLDCMPMNRDSLRQLGWQIVWDTTWTD